MLHKPLYNVKPIRDMKDMLQQSQKLYGNKDAFLIKEKDNTYKGIKYNEFKHNIDALGTAFLHLGLKDAFIAIISENRYEWCVSYLATVNGTGVVVPLDKELPSGEIRNLLLQSKARAVVFSGKYEKDMRSLAGTLPNLDYFINMDSAVHDENFLSYSCLVEKGAQLLKSGDRSFIDVHINENAMSVLLFTSGTTDLAKGVMLSHTNICSDVMAVCASLYIDSSDSVLSILPLHHTYECTAGFLVMIYNGCTIAFNEGLKHISKNLKETRPSILILVPLIIESMYKKIWEQAGKKRSTKLKLKAALFISDCLYALGIDLRKKLFKQILDNIGGRVRLIIAGAAAIDPAVSKGLRSMGITVLQGYGLTECAPIVAVNRDKVFNDASIGQPLPGVEIKILNPDSEGVGELAVKGDNVMLGYFDNPEATAKVLKDGWLHTGDLGFRDSNDFYYITGRQKNVIVTKNGKNIYPEELEAVLNKNPYILESLVSGEQDASGETMVKVAIVPEIEAVKARLKQEELSQEELYKFISSEIKAINRSMPLYKRMSRVVVQEDEFVKTTTKKIKRYAVK